MTEQELRILELKQRIAAGEKPARDSGLEKHLERDCTQILVADGWRALKTNPVRNKSRGIGFGEPGMADDLYIRYDLSFRWLASVLWIEYKRLDGVVAEHQKEWHKRERARGALVWVAGEDFEATVEDFCDFYQRSGLMRANRMEGTK